jgi:hypothetical protein
MNNSWISNDELRKLKLGKNFVKIHCEQEKEVFCCWTWLHPHPHFTLFAYKEKASPCHTESRKTKRKRERKGRQSFCCYLTRKMKV